MPDSVKTRISSPGAPLKKGIIADNTSKGGDRVTQSVNKYPDLKI